MTKTETPAPLSDHSIAFLTQECDRMLSLYSQAQSNAQSVFNFYLTFVTTVIGAVVVLLQVVTSNVEAILAGVLFFAVIVGVVYLAALSGRYAHAFRYAHAVDELRRYLIERLQVPMPASYDNFLVEKNRSAKSAAWVYWLIPTGTYQLFVALVNSTALAAVVWLIMDSAGASDLRGLVGSLLVFGLTLTISNAYSRLVIVRFGNKLNVDLWNDSPAWASRE